jgi:hypothetical protein
MFVKRTSVKSGGRVLTYLQLMETYRDGARIRQRLVTKLGREDQVDPSDIDRLIRSLAPYGSVTVGDEQSLEDVELDPGWEYGSLHALDFVWNELGLPRILGELAAGRRFGFDVAAVVKAIVFGRVRKPGSERALVTRWLAGVYAPEFAGIELQHAYRALAFLAEVGPELEARLARVLVDQLFVDATLVLFDTTSTYFEGVGPEGLASFGYSRDKRGDRPQVNFGLLTSREGYPLAHWLFPGKQSDVKSMALASREFRERLALASFVVVADRGMVSEANLETLREEGITYIIAERLRRKTAHEALARAGRYKRVTSTIEVKEIKRDGLERVILCRNQERAAEDAATRQSILENLEQQLEAGSWRESLKPAARRYLKVDGASARLDVKRIEADARYDGKWILRTTTNLPADQVALAYRGLWRVENAFRTIKTPLELRPIHHTSAAGVRGHVQTCVLAYLLTCILQDRLDDAGLGLNVNDALDQLARIQRIPVETGSHQIVKTTRPNEQQRAILEAIGAPTPPQHQVA